MLHILLVIFKVIAGILLVLLGIFLFLLLGGLLAPLRYQVRGERSKEKWSVQGSVSWLFHAVYIKGSFDGSSPKYECYLLGLPLFRLKGWLDQKRSKKPGKKRKKDAGHPYHPMGENVPGKDKSASQDKPEPETKENQKSIQKSEPKKNLPPKSESATGKNLQSTPESAARVRESQPKKPHSKGIWNRIKETIKKVVNLPRKIYFTIKEDCGKISKWKSILQSEDVRWLKNMGINKTKAAIGHIRPRRVRGEVLFGFEDPSHTGELLGFLGILYPRLPRKLTLIPNFTEAVLEGWLEARGRLYGIFFLVQLLQVLFDGKTIKTVKKFMHKEA